MKKHQMDFVVESCERLSAKALHIICVPAGKSPMPDMLPGQFVQVQVPDSGVLLRRPISIHDVRDGALHLLVQMVGRGTRSLAALQPGDTLNIVLPLGNGFPQPDNRRTLLVGGGIGIAPLLYLGRELKSRGNHVEYLLGGRTAADILRLDEYSAVAPVNITTEDGTLGERGFVTNHSVLRAGAFDSLFVCGPTPMMRAVAQWTAQNHTDCHVSLENMMACGLGACLCCVHKNSEGHNVCVCTDGPVFNINQLDWV